MKPYGANIFHFYTNRSFYSRRQGFTLTEMAIIIGVIAIVMSGVFVAGSAALYRQQLNQGIDELGQIVVNMRSLYAGQNVSAAAAVAFPGATFIQKMVFPSEMLVPTLPVNGIPPAGTVANNPWDQNLLAGTAQIQVCPSGSACAVVGFPVAQFAVRYLNISAEVCADLLVRNSLPGPDTGLLQIKVNGAAVGTLGGVNPLPVSPTTAATACFVGGANYSIDWYYTLGS